MLSLQWSEDNTNKAKQEKFNYCWSWSLPLEGHLGQLGPAIHKHLQSHIDHLTEHLQKKKRPGYRNRSPAKQRGTRHT